MILIASVHLAARAAHSSDWVSRLLISLGLVLVGSVLAFDVKGISAKMLERNAGFAPLRRGRPWTGPNPARLVGALFAVGGVAGLIAVAVNH